MKKSRVLLRGTVSGDYWCGLFGWLPMKSKALPMTDVEASIRIGIEIQLGAPITGFQLKRVWVNEDNELIN